MNRMMLKRIEHASDEAMLEIVMAITRRYDRLFPDYEVLFTSLHREGPGRRKDIQQLCEFLLRIEDRRDAERSC